jgi:hypothetical protein
MLCYWPDRFSANSISFETSMSSCTVLGNLSVLRVASLLFCHLWSLACFLPRFSQSYLESCVSFVMPLPAIPRVSKIFFSSLCNCRKPRTLIGLDWMKSEQHYVRLSLKFLIWVRGSLGLLSSMKTKHSKFFLP